MSKNTVETSRKTSNRRAASIMLIGLLLLLNAILFGVFGHSGSSVRGFIIGVFGYSIYAFSISSLISEFFILFGVKKKVPGKIIFYYASIIIIIMAMSHIATSREIASNGYSSYYKEAFSIALTAGKANTIAGTILGALGCIVLYPLTQLYAFSMVMLTLFLIGFVALAIVSQVNTEFAFKVRQKTHITKSSSKKSNNVKEFSNNDYPQQPQRSLYNGDIKGKEYDKKKQNTFKSRTIDYVPIEEIKENKSIDEIDDMLAGIGIEETVRVDDKSLDDEIALAKSRSSIFEKAPLVDMPQIEEKPVDELGNEIKESKKKDDTPFLFSNNIMQKRMEENERRYKEQEEKKKLEQQQNETKPSFEPIQTTIEDFIADDVVENKQDELEDDLDPIEKLLQEPIDIEDIKDEKIVNNEKDIINELDVDEKNKLSEDSAKRIKKEDNVNPQQIKMDIEPRKIDETPKIRKIGDIPVEEDKPKKRVIKPYVRPDLDILDDYEDRKGCEDDETIEIKKQALINVLNDFKIPAEIIAVVKGPTFYRIDFKLQAGVSVSKVANIERDILTALEVDSMRLLLPVPGKAYNGVELPNKIRGVVPLKKVLQSSAFAMDNKKGLTLALGANINGEYFAPDLTKLTHLLVAGGTGAGKSVCINCMIAGLLYKYSPEDLRMILIDPKQVEFVTYEHIPHLLIPRIINNDPKRVIAALNWLCEEMERRYSTLTYYKLKNIDEYNQSPEVKENPEKKIPYILTIVDEFGDLMLSDKNVAKKIEDAMTKLAAKARASGIHLILATQSPRKEVVTGTLKTNLPASIALTTKTAVDSTVILGHGGAEKLLRYGDMLLQDPTARNDERLQCALIETMELNALVEQVVKRNDSYFDPAIEAAIMTDPEPASPLKSNDDIEFGMVPGDENRIDPLYIKALRECLQAGSVSVSLIQRKLGVGYPKAGRIFDWIESSGYIVDLDSSGKRKGINLTKEQIDKIEEDNQ